MFIGFFFVYNSSQIKKYMNTHSHLTGGIYIVYFLSKVSGY